MTLNPRAEISLVLATLFLSMPGGAVAQDAEPLMAACTIFDELSIIHEPDSFTVAEALTLTDEILEAVGLTRNFEVVASNKINNAAAVILRNEASPNIGERFIIYNPDWVHRKIPESRWGVIGLLAHEIGHHLQGHTLDCGKGNPADELEADRFAGNVLGKLGATERQAFELWEQLGEQGSETHPPRAERLTVVALGWNNGRRRRAPLDFDLSRFNGQNCRNREYIKRIYMAGYGPSGLPDVELSHISNDFVVLDGTSFSFSIEGDTLRWRWRRGRELMEELKVEDYDFYGSSLHVTANYIPPWTFPVTYEFQKDGMIRKILRSVEPLAGRARVTESTTILRECNYTGVPNFWDQ